MEHHQVDLMRSLVVEVALVVLDKMHLQDRLMVLVVPVVLDSKTHLEMVLMYFMPGVAVVLDTQEIMREPLVTDRVKVEKVAVVPVLSQVTQVPLVLELLTLEVVQEVITVLVDLELLLFDIKFRH
jgi:hypothetical protein